MFLTLRRSFLFARGINLFLSSKAQKFFLGIGSVLMWFYLPSMYYFRRIPGSLELLFTMKFFFKGFISHLRLYYNCLLTSYFIKLRIRGLGYRITEITLDWYSFFFNRTNYVYFVVPLALLVRVYKKRMLLVSKSWHVLRIVLNQVLSLKRLGPYELRGIRLVKQIMFLKVSEKSV